MRFYSKNEFYLSISFFSLAFLASLLLNSFVYAQSSEEFESSIPDQLQPWVNWVKEKNEKRACYYTESREQEICHWNSKVELSISEKEALFTQEISVESNANQMVPIVGGGNTWPHDIRIISTKNGGSVLVTPIVLQREGTPHLKLSKGSYTVKGKLTWSKTPKFIFIPQDSAIVNLPDNGGSQKSPLIYSRQIFLSSEDSPSNKIEKENNTRENNAETLEVFRFLKDGSPFIVTTLIKLKVSGSTREINLGNVGLEGFEVSQIESPTTSYLNKNKELIVRAASGSYEITLTEVSNQPTEKITQSKNNFPNWPKEEIFIWSPDENYRSTEVTNASEIDPKLYSTPKEWLGNAAYLVQEAKPFELRTLKRGLQNLPTNQFKITKNIWLSLDGQSLSTKDVINTEINQDWRVNSKAELQLQRVSLNSVDQLITSDPKTKLQGVEVRNSKVELLAETKKDYPGNNLVKVISMPAVGWDNSANSLQTNLTLPPGWRVFTGFGMDSIIGSYISSWSLYDFYLLGLIVIAAYKLFGFKVGFIALITILLTRHEANSPYGIWLSILISCGLLRLVKTGFWGGLFKLFQRVSFLALAVFSLGFMIDHLYYAIHPSSIPGCQASGGSNFTSSYQSASFVRGGAYDSLNVAEQSPAPVAMAGSSGMPEDAAMSESQEVMSGEVELNLPQKGVLKKSPKMVKPLDRHTVNKRNLNNRDTMNIREDKTIQSQDKKLTNIFGSDAVIQAGSGMPDWSCSSWLLRWDGPVEKDHTFKIILFGPWMNLVLAFLRVALIFIFAYLILKPSLLLNASTDSEKLSKGNKANILGILTKNFLLVGLFLVATLNLQTVSSSAQNPPSSTSSSSSFPSPELLAELEQRIFRDDCVQDCFSNNSLSVTIFEDKVSFVAEISSQGKNAWALPTLQNNQSFIDIRNQEKVEQSGLLPMMKDKDGLLRVKLLSGSNKIYFDLPLSGNIELNFKTPPKVLLVTNNSKAWSYAGIDETGLLSGSFKITRNIESNADENLSVNSKNTFKNTKENDSNILPLKPWIIVNRKLNLGLTWEVETTVQNLGSSEKSFSFDLPLLQDEQVLDSQLKVSDNKVKITFQPGQDTISYTSSLSIKNEYKLQALNEANLNEVWSLSCSPIWRCDFGSDLPFVSYLEGSQNVFTWKPWQKEELKILVSKPEAIPGKSIVVENVNYKLAPGKKIAKASLELKVRANKAEFLAVTLPPQNNFKVLIDNNKADLQIANNILNVPLKPETKNIQISWEQNWEDENLKAFPEVKIAAPLANINYNLTPSRDTWLVLTGGTIWGPNVLFWSKLTVLLIFSFILAKFKIKPLTFFTSFLLGFGLLTASEYLVVIPLLWFLLLNYRLKRPLQGRFRFNLLQLFLVFLSLVTIIVLVVVVQNGLLYSPDFDVQGLNSNRYSINWFVDFADTTLPQPWVISFPLWVWRAVMFVWGIWLAASLISWLKYAWECFTFEGAWKSRVKNDSTKKDSVKDLVTEKTST